MRRLTTALTAEEFGRATLNLGRADENAAVRVEIDLSAILAQEPSASAHLTVESPVGAKYPASTTMDGGKLIWDVTDADTAAEGTGRAQLTVTGPGGEVLKSAVAVTRVGHSLRGEGEAPEPLKSWVDDAVAKLAAVENAIKDAQQVADDIRQKLESGELVGPQGPQGPKGPPGEVEDVKIGDSSLVANGMAILPNVLVLSHDGKLRTYLAPGSTKWTGNIGINEDGTIILANTTQSIINNRYAGSKQFISAGILDYAVKAALCDGKGEAWTVEEKKAALARLGLSLADDGAINWEG